MAKAYEHFFFHYTASDLLVVDTSEIDFVNRSQDLALLLKRLSEPIKGKQYFLPRLPSERLLSLFPAILIVAYRTPPCPRAGLSPPVIVILTIHRRIFFSPTRGHRAVDKRRSSCPCARSDLAPTRHLTEQPSLEQLRKQAKELLQEFRSGAPSALAEVNQFERNADSGKFALNDAQRVIARAYGFASWPKLKAFVDGANIARFAEAVQGGDVAQVRVMLASRPELVAMDRAENDEHRGLHYAVLRRDAAMARILMEAGADARKGIWPHRDATSAWTIAQERQYDDIVAVIEEEERHRREEMSCSNATGSPGAGRDQFGHRARRRHDGDATAG